MDKADWYFLASTAFDVFAFLGVEWKTVRDRAVVPNMSRQRLVLGLIAVAFVANVIGWYESSKKTTVFTTEEWLERAKHLELVVNKEISNQEVILDGKSFQDCTFNNVTFIYKGTAPFLLTHNHLNGTNN